MKAKNVKSHPALHTSPAAGIPSPAMTDQQWQQEFRLMRRSAQPARRRTLSERPQEHILCDEFGNKRYDGYSIWQTYCTYINDVLGQIRRGKVDYCYYTYQIHKLLTFERCRLQTKYYPSEQYWAVWLEEER